jgi:Secretion system C-terminal sorting domain
MSTNFKTLICLASLVVITSTGLKAQIATLELPNNGSVPPQGVGPVSPPAGIGPLFLLNDADNVGANNTFITPIPAQTTSVTFKFINQQYSGLNYFNVGTGLTFGAAPTTAVDLTNNPPRQEAQPTNVFTNLGTFSVNPGGPTAGMFSSHPTLNAGGGILPVFDFNTGTFGNGAVQLFTAAQVQFDGGKAPVGGGSAPYPIATPSGTANRYYYGDFQITFSRFVKDPVVHFAGLGGSYSYIPIGGVQNPNDPANWLRTFFSTELELVGALPTSLSGNSFFNVSGNSITNTAVSPDGASVSTNPINGSDPFDHLGAASGSIRVNGTYRTLTFKVYLRGSNSSNFGWSALGTASNTNLNTRRDPLTGDIWLVSVSAGVESLIPLPATGINLSASLTGSDVALSWKTLTEINSNRFDIERSTDGINFAKIGEKAAAGYSTSDVNYSYADAGMNVSVYYYRLKLVDLDGKVSYSNIATVRKSSIKTIKVFPNPAVENLSVEFSNAKGSYTITLLNQAGQEVQNIKADISNTVQYVKISRNNVAAGMYYIRVKENNTGEVMSEKVLIK